MGRGYPIPKPYTYWGTPSGFTREELLEHCQVPLVAPVFTSSGDSRYRPF